MKDSTRSEFKAHPVRLDTPVRKSSTTATAGSCSTCCGNWSERALTSRHMTVRRPLARDTHPKAEELQLDIYRRMPVWRKLELVEDSMRSAEILAIAGLRRRHPEAGEAELRRRLMDLVLGSEIASRAFGGLEDA